MFPGATGRARRDGGLEPLTEVTVHSQVDSSHRDIGARAFPVLGISSRRELRTVPP
jgi:hypothetical protein